MKVHISGRNSRLALRSRRLGRPEFENLRPLNRGIWVRRSGPWCKAQRIAHPHHGRAFRTGRGSPLQGAFALETWKRFIPNVRRQVSWLPDRMKHKRNANSTEFGESFYRKNLRAINAQADWADEAALRQCPQVECTITCQETVVFGAHGMHRRPPGSRWS